jgi:hypothetical protein
MNTNASVAVAAPASKSVMKPPNAATMPATGAPTPAASPMLPTAVASASTTRVLRLIRSVFVRFSLTALAVCYSLSGVGEFRVILSQRGSVCLATDLIKPTIHGDEVLAQRVAPSL